MNDRHAEEQIYLAAERTRLAAERTWLSWVRTGLAGVGGGVAIVRFIHFNSPVSHEISFWVGLLFVLWGMAIFVLSTLDFERECKNLSTVYMTKKPSMGNKRLIIGMLCVLSLLMLFLLIT